MMEASQLCAKKLRKNVSSDPPVLASCGVRPDEGPYALEFIDFRNTARPFEVWNIPRE